MAGIKIVDLPALGRDLAATDLLELSLAGGTGSRKITGQEIINASKLNVGNTPIINGTAGRLLFQSTGNVLSQSGNLFWDNTNGRLGIGTSTPTFTLDVLGPQYGGFRFMADGSTFLRLDTTTTNFQISHSNTETSLTTGNYGPLYFINNGGGQIRLSLFANGNFAIGTTTDAGYKLDVNGTARVQNTITLTGINTPNNANLPLALGNFTLDVQTTNPNSAAGSIITTGAITRTDTGVKHIINVNNAVTSTAANFNTLNGFAFTSTINQTLGTIRGIYIAPTLTASTDFRAIETTAGNVIFNGGNVGIGTSSPAYNLDVNGTSRFKNNVDIVLRGADTSWDSRILNNYEWFFKAGNYTGYINFGWGSGSALRIQQNGNVLINTTTDAGYRLDVNGTARVNGELRAGNLQILTSGSAGGTGQGIVVTGGDTTFQFNGSGGSLAVDMFQFRNWAGTTITAQPINADKSVIRIYGGFLSGNVSNLSGNTLSITPTYNLTGNATIVRGIYYNPTLTSLTNGTHFAFHSTSGRVRFEGLPTSPTGLNAGDLWNDAGTLRIV